jgi:hypothetical protein
LINNGIHPGEPDGIDASMMLVRDIVNKKIQLPNNVAVAFIPVYNIGGCLNRNQHSRVNQNGPIAYGFRGNAQNLDLNRDFTKADSKEAQSFSSIFHWLNPDIFIDNHVSDGADYQYTITLLTTQYDKLGSILGSWLKATFEPKLYQSMKAKNFEMTPYVNFETAGPEKGMEMFYDPPRYSSGYAALFQTIAFVPETHMLKPFADRVKATYALMQTFIEQASANASTLLNTRKKAIEAITTAQQFPLSWSVDSTRFDTIVFKGYQQAFKTSEATGLTRMYYNRNQPYTLPIRFYNSFSPNKFVSKPIAYIIPQGWHQVIDRLALNKINMKQLEKDSSIEVEQYKIDYYQTYNRAYEKHYKHYNISTTASTTTIRFLKGDYIIPLNQSTNRFLMEMLEPQGEDSYFAWNFFDAILQQKEGYSDYRWEDIAAEVLKDNPAIQKALDTKKASDPKFAANASAQLDFIYKQSPYYEPVHLRYPVFRLVK